MKKGFYISLIISYETFCKVADLVVDKNLYQGLEIFYPETKEVSLDHQRKLDYLIEKNYLSKFEITCHLPFMPNSINIASKNEEMKEHSLSLVKKGIDYGYSYGARIFPLHLGRRESIEDSYEEYYQRNLQSIQEILEYCKKYEDIFLALENLPDPCDILRTKEDMKRILSDVNSSKIKIMLDTGHLGVVDPNSLRDYILELKENLVHVHIHDNHKKMDEHLNLGEGELDLPLVLNTLKEIGYKGVIEVETGYKVSDYLKNSKYLDNYLE